MHLVLDEVLQSTQKWNPGYTVFAQIRGQKVDP